MADKKVSELDAITGADTAADDLFLIVDSSGSVTKKITRAELNNAIEQDVLAQVDITSANIDGGTIDNTPIGAATASTGSFTDLTVTGTVTGITQATGNELENIVEDTTPQLGGDLDTNGNDITFGDNDKAVFGAGSDLEISSNGTDGFIRNGNATGEIRIESDDRIVICDRNFNEAFAIFNDDDDVKLYHNNAAKLATTSTGVDVTGTVTADGLTVAGGITTTVATVALDVAEESSGADGLIGLSAHGSARSQIRSTHTLGTSSDLRFLTVDGGSTRERLKLANNGDVSLYASDGLSQGLFWDASTQRLGLGTTSPARQLHLSSSSGGGMLSVERTGATTSAFVVAADSGKVSLFSRDTNSGTGNVPLAFHTGSTERMRIDSSGNVGIGKSSSITDKLHIENTGANCLLSVARTDGAAGRLVMQHTSSVGALQTTGSVPLTFGTADTERMRIDSSGNLLHQRTSNTISGTSVNKMTLGDGTGQYGVIVDVGSGSGYYGFAKGGTYNSRIRYDYTGDFMALDVNGSERMRIESDGDILFGKTVKGTAEPGMIFDNEGSNNFSLAITSSNNPVLFINRQSADGTLVQFRHANTTEGSIVVSGTTVSYNGGHLARFSQATDGNRIDGLVKGTVMTNLDQMAEWTKDGVTEDNEQLNCMAVSSVEGDANVAGVFVNWDDDDTDFTADMNVAMTGDMVIRIASGTTVARGDLLMSAGDGTAKPQGDDIVRSKTIAKVTSTNVSHTYDDGSYLVPCVLMAC